MGRLVAVLAGVVLVSVPALGADQSVILRVGDATLPWSSTDPVFGHVEVWAQLEDGTTIPGFAGYDLALDLVPPESGLALVAGNPSTDHTPALPGAIWNTFTVPDKEMAVSAYLASGSQTLDNGDGLARVDFQVEPGVTGTYDVTIDTAWTNLSDESGNPMAYDGVIDGTITIVPEPATTLLVLGGAVGLAAFRRRKA